MSTYSEAEIKAFEEKDLRIIKMNCLNRAVELYIAVKDYANLKGICATADVFVDWVYLPRQEVKKEIKVPEKLTPKQNKVLLGVLAEIEKNVPEGFIVSIEKLKTFILSLSKKGEFPDDVKVVSVIVKNIKIDEVISSVEETK